MDTTSNGSTTVDHSVDSPLVSLEEGTNDSTLREVENVKNTMRTCPKGVWMFEAFIVHTIWGGMSQISCSLTCPAYTPLARYLQTGDASLPTFSLLFFVSLAVYLFFSLFFVPKVGFGWIKQKKLWIFALVTACRSFTNIASTRFTKAVYVQLIALLTPFFVGLLSRLWLKEPLPRFTIPAFSLSLIGALLMLSSGNLSNGSFFSLTVSDGIGISLALISVIFLAWCLVFIRHLQHTHKMRAGDILLSQFMVTTLLSPVASLILREDWTMWKFLSPIGWVVFGCFIAIFVSGNILQQHAIEKLGSATLASSPLPWRLAISLLLGIVMLDENLTSILQLFGMLIVLVAVGGYLLLQLYLQKKASLPQEDAIELKDQLLEEELEKL